MQGNKFISSSGIEKANNFKIRITFMAKNVYPRIQFGWVIFHSMYPPVAERKYMK